LDFFDLFHLADGVLNHSVLNERAASAASRACRRLLHLGLLVVIVFYAVLVLPLAREYLIVYVGLARTCCFEIVPFAEIFFLSLLEPNIRGKLMFLVFVVMFGFELTSERVDIEVAVGLTIIFCGSDPVVISFIVCIK
jgi:hypothetical protein